MIHRSDYDAKDSWILAGKYHEVLQQYTSDEPTTTIAITQSVLLFAGLTIGRILASARNTAPLQEAIEHHVSAFREYLRLGIQSAQDPEQVPLPYS